MQRRQRESSWRVLKRGHSFCTKLYFFNCYRANSWLPKCLRRACMWPSWPGAWPSRSLSISFPRGTTRCCHIWGEAADSCPHREVGEGGAGVGAFPTAPHLRQPPGPAGPLRRVQNGSQGRSSSGHCRRPIPERWAPSVMPDRQEPFIL